MATVVIGDNIGDDFAGTEDTHLKEGNPTTNFGTLNLLEITKYAANDHTYSALAFSGLSNITPMVTVSAVSLNLYIVTSTVGAGKTATFRKFIRNWSLTQATWSIYTTGNNWSTAGGISDGNDRSATTSGTLAIEPAGSYYANTDSQLATDVEGFINSGSNYGWHIERTDAGEDTSFSQWRAENGADGQRPYLSVTYSAAVVGGLPAGSLSCLGVGI